MAQTSKEFKDSIQVVINNLSSDSLKTTTYYNASIDAFQPHNDLELAKSYVDSARHYALLTNNKSAEARCYFMYGLIERFKGNYDVALNHLNKNIQYFKDSSVSKSYALFQVAAIHSSKGDFENSVEIFFEILDIFEKDKDSFAIASTHNNIAILYTEMDQNLKSIDTYKKALVIFEQLDAKRDLSNVLRNIGEMYLRELDTVTGKTYIEKSLKVAYETKEDYAIGFSLFALGSVYLKSDSKKGLKYLTKAKRIIEKGNYKSLLTDINAKLGSHYSYVNEHKKAISYFNTALELAKETDELPKKEKIYKGISEAYKKQGNYNTAYNYLSKHIVVKDSLLNLENLKAINLLETKYETAKKENDILTLTSEKLKSETAITKQQARIKFLTIGLVTLAVLFTGIFIIFKQSTKSKKQKELITAITETQIEERKRIAQDLHDGVGGTLALAKNKLEVLLSSEKEKSKEVSEFMETLSDTANQIRQISHNMMPGELVKFGLVSAVQTTLDQIENQDLKTHLYTHDLDDRIDQTKEIHTFRIIQEIIQNVLKHANAKTLNVHLNRYPKILNLLVEDDGIGFAYNAATANGLGLKNIKSRVHYLNGKFHVDSASGKGTTFNIEIPL